MYNNLYRKRPIITNQVRGERIMSKSKVKQVTSVTSANQICVLTTNGNFVQAIKDKTKAILELRTMAGKNLGVDTTKAEVFEKNNVVGLKGIDRWRIKLVDLL